MSVTYDKTTNSIVIDTGYNKGFVYNLKQNVSAQWRGFDPDKKTWVVVPEHAPTVARLVNQYYGIDASNVVEQCKGRKRILKKGILELIYLGQCKPRDDGELWAFGSDSWTGSNFIFLMDEHVLRNWFDGKPLPDAPSTPNMVPVGSHFHTLGLRKLEVTPEEVKSAYRQMARQNHPDMTTDPKEKQVFTERFMRIQQAYDALSDEKTLQRYVAALKIAGASPVAKAPKGGGYDALSGVYYPDLRTGKIACTYWESIGRKYIHVIHDWQPIKNAQGEELAVAWDASDSRNQKPILIWG